MSAANGTAEKPLTGVARQDCAMFERKELRRTLLVDVSKVHVGSRLLLRWCGHKMQRAAHEWQNHGYDAPFV